MSKKLPGTLVVPSLAVVIVYALALYSLIKELLFNSDRINCRKPPSTKKTEGCIDKPVLLFSTLPLYGK